MRWLFGKLNDLLNGWKPMPKPDPQPVDPVDPPTVDQDEALLKLHNGERNGSYPLVINAQLKAAAVQHAQWMAANNTMSHQQGRRSVADRAKDAGYNWSYVGENIAAGYPDVNAVFRGWMNSPGHRSNIVNRNYKDVGFGIAKASNGTIYWCAVFGRSGM